MPANFGIDTLKVDLGLKQRAAPHELRMARLASNVIEKDEQEYLVFGGPPYDAWLMDILILAEYPVPMDGLVDPFLSFGSASFPLG